MRYQVIIAAIVFATSISAQQPLVPVRPSIDKVFDFANKPSPQGLQEIATILRTVGDLQHVSLDANASTVTVNATSGELEMAGWIIRKLDHPPGTPASSVDEFLVPPGTQRNQFGGDDVVRVFYLGQASSPQRMQEMLTVLRTVVDLQKVFNYAPLSALVLRGPAAQVKIVEDLIGSLDIVPGHAKASDEFQYDVPRVGTQKVQVFYLSSDQTVQGIQEILTVLRTVGDIQKVFNVTAIKALAIRGTSDEIAVAKWLIQSLDLPVAADARPPSGSQEFLIPGAIRGDSVVRVFYPSRLKTAGLPQTSKLLRSNLEITKTFYCSSPPAIVVRGSADQIAKAELLIQEQDQLAGNTP